MMKMFLFNARRALGSVGVVRSIHSSSSSEGTIGLSKPYYWKQEWKNDKELYNYLMNNIIYRDADMVAFNKPIGISMFKSNYENSDILPSNTSDFLSINSCETYLKKELGVQNLYCVLSQNRMHSGIIAYCFDKELSKSLSHYFKNAKINKKCVTGYDLICLGHMKMQSGSKTICVGQILNGNQATLVEDDAFKIGRKKTTTSLMDFNVVKKSKVAFKCTSSHLKVHTSCTKWSSLELLAIRLMTPILGDHKYSSRVQILLDKPIHIDPQNAMPQPQDVPADICNLLGVDLNQTEDIPLHIHCSQVIMPKIFKNKGVPQFSRKCLQNVLTKEKPEENSSLSLSSFYTNGTLITAPLPPYFMETLRRLQLL